MEEDLIQIFEMLIAIVAAIIAYWQHHKKTIAENRTGEVIGSLTRAMIPSPPHRQPSRHGHGR